jgi:hypothetical protein
VDDDDDSGDESSVIVRVHAAFCTGTVGPLQD